MRVSEACAQQEWSVVQPAHYCPGGSSPQGCHADLRISAFAGWPGRPTSTCSLCNSGTVLRRWYCAGATPRRAEVDAGCRVQEGGNGGRSAPEGGHGVKVGLHHAHLSCRLSAIRHPQFWTVCPTAAASRR